MKVIQQGAMPYKKNRHEDWVTIAEALGLQVYNRNLLTNKLINPKPDGNALEGTLIASISD